MVFDVFALNVDCNFINLMTHIILQQLHYVKQKFSHMQCNKGTLININVGWPDHVQCFLNLHFFLTRNKQ